MNSSLSYRAAIMAHSFIRQSNDAVSPIVVKEKLDFVYWGHTRVAMKQLFNSRVTKSDAIECVSDWLTHEVKQFWTYSYCHNPKVWNHGVVELIDELATEIWEKEDENLSDGK